MGMLRTRWQATVAGHQVEVERNELTKGFSVAIDGKVVARKRWSMIGSGRLESALAHEGGTRWLVVRLVTSFRRPACVIELDGTPIPVTQAE